MSDQEAALRAELAEARVQIREIAAERDQATAELRGVVVCLREVTAERDQAQADAVLLLDTWRTGHLGFIAGKVMDRVDQYKVAVARRKSCTGGVS